MPAPPVHRRLCAWLILILAWVARVRADGSETGGPNTSLAMIILYAITGCVSALFCVVIVSGAIRAIRHPERYGPRTGEGEYAGTFPSQSRARGLTRAILDTFPVVKFGMESTQQAHGKDVEMGEVKSAAGECDSRESESLDGEGDVKAAEDAEEHTPAHARRISWAPQVLERESGEKEAREMVGVVEVPETEEDITAATDPDLPPSATVAGPSSPSRTSPDADLPPARPRPRHGRSSMQGRPVSAPGGVKEKDIVPDAIGTETCPICILDFEEGDDLRVLPCEGKHRFHRDCVDQWLLELSSSCPICRQDFQALENMMLGGGSEEHLEPPHPAYYSGYGHRPLSSAAARFSRYLRFARRRHGQRTRDRRAGREDGSGYDITDPPMPMSVAAGF